MCTWEKPVISSLPGVTWVTSERTGLIVVETTADAVTGVTALTAWPVAMATTSAGAAVAVTVLCCAWTTCAPAVPAGYINQNNSDSMNKGFDDWVCCFIPIQILFISLYVNSARSPAIRKDDSQTAFLAWPKTPGVCWAGKGFEELQLLCWQSHSPQQWLEETKWKELSTGTQAAL